MILEQMVAGKSQAQVAAMADKLEKMADAMAPLKGAGAKTAGVKAGAGKAVAAKAAGTGIAKTGGVSVGKTAVGMSAKSGSASSIAACCSKGLGLGLGLGNLGPILVIAGGAAASWYAYKKYFQRDIDAPTI